MNETLQAKDQSNRPRCEATHSPLPWTVSKNAMDYTCIWTTQPSKNIIAKLYNVPFEESTEANAAYIVKACNEYPEIVRQRDELLEACKNAERELEEGVMSGVVAQHLRAVIRERY